MQAVPSGPVKGIRQRISFSRRWAGAAAQFRARVPSGSVPPARSAAVASCSAVSATRWVNGPVDTRATPSSCSSRTGSDAPGTLMTLSFCGAELLDEHADLLPSDDTRNEHHRCPSVQEGLSAADRLLQQRTAVGVGVQEHVVASGREHCLHRGDGFVERLELTSRLDDMP